MLISLAGVQRPEQFWGVRDIYWKKLELSISFFVCRDDSIVGQVGNLDAIRPHVRQVAPLLSRAQNFGPAFGPRRLGFAITGAV
jgi:hypothetical protein